MLVALKGDSDFMRFHVKAVSQGGAVSQLEIEAGSAAEAGARIAGQGYRVLSLTSARPLLSAGKLQGRFSLLIFSQELLALLDAGLGLIEALSALARKEQRESDRAMLEDILSTLRRGEGFSAALARFSGQFPPIYVAAIQASERTSNLREALARYIVYAEQYDRARKQITNALIYPSIVVAVGVLVIMFLLLYVVPRFARVYEGFHGDLPVFSVALLFIGQTIDRHGVLLAGVLALMFASGAWALSNEAIRRRLGESVLGLSWLREKFRLLQLARMYRTLGMLLRGGIPVLTAGNMVAPLLGGVERGHLNRALELIREGRAISDAMESAGLTTPVGLSLLAVGERSGRMGDAMERAAAFHDEEITRWTEHFVRLFEPVIMAALGIIVGGIVVMMYMPIFELAGIVQ